MTTKEANLYGFYEQCLKKGYCDMADDTQSLKAKVIATDLGIKYKDIAVTYDEAKTVYENENERRRQAEILQNTPGEMVLKFMTKASENIIVYRRADGSLYHTCNGSDIKFEGAPSISVHSGGSLLYTYHPSKTVFTGAASGPIAMGGFHETEAYYSEKVTSSGKGYIEIKAKDDTSITVKTIEVSQFVINKFKRVEWFKRNVGKSGTIYCYDTSETSTSQMFVQTALQSDADYYTKMNMISMAADRERLSMQACKDISSFLNDVLSERYPATDEQIYEQAKTLESATTSAKLMEAIEIYNRISDYKDAKKRAEDLKKKYDEVLQYEKEQAVLKKEADAVKRKEMMKKLKFIIPAAIAVIIVGVVASNMMKKSKAYDMAMEYLEAGKYEYAKEAFEDLEDYKDSATMAIECDYQKALSIAETGRYDDAIDCFEDLGDYSDSCEQINMIHERWMAEADALDAQGDYEGAIDTYRDIMNTGYKEISEVCFEKIEAIEVKIAKAEEEARLAEELRIKEEAYKTKDVTYFAERFMEYRRLSGEEISEMIVGEWFVKTESVDKAYRYDYLEDGTTISYNTTTGGEVIELKAEYSVEDDYLIDALTFEIFELEQGHYLMINTGTVKFDKLLWPATQVSEEEELQNAVSETENNEDI